MVPSDFGALHARGACLDSVITAGAASFASPPAVMQYYMQSVLSFMGVAKNSAQIVREIFRVDPKSIQQIWVLVRTSTQDFRRRKKQNQKRIIAAHRAEARAILRR